MCLYVLLELRKSARVRVCMGTHKYTHVHAHHTEKNHYVYIVYIYTYEMYTNASDCFTISLDDF